MSDSKITVRRKESGRKSRKTIKLLIGSAIAVCFIVVLLAGLFVFSDRLSFASANLEITANGKNKLIRVPKGANLQAAIDKADGGDIIELEAGAVYENVILPKKDIKDFITIRSSKADQLPENKRVNPAQANLMAKIVIRKNGAAVDIEKAAHHYRFVGIEFAPDTKDYIYNLIFLGEPEKLADVAHHFEFDRCFIHSIDQGVTRRGIAVNSADTTITNSYFQGFAYPQEETQGICGWTGTKNVKIINNYIEGGAENIMFGGADAKSADLIPTDIEVRGNHFFKPVEWRDKNFTTKCLFEIKTAKRLSFTENYLENNWIGSAFRITIRNDNGTAPFNTIEDVVIKNNVINGAGDGINILGKDDGHESLMMRGLTIVNNVFLNIGGKEFDGNGYFVQIADGRDILIANNTVFNEGNITQFHRDLPQNFVFRDNIVGHGDYGIHGLDNVKSAVAQGIFQNNLFVNNHQIPISDFSIPPNNFVIQSYQDIGFVNLSDKDFRLLPSSRFKAKGADKTDIGANLNVKEIMR